MTEKERLERAKQKSFLNHKLYKKLTDKKYKYDTDPDSQERLCKRLCKTCFYINVDRIAGQAFTNLNCELCGKVMTFPTTDTDCYCLDCSIKLGVCAHCGGLMD